MTKNNNTNNNKKRLPNGKGLGNQFKGMPEDMQITLNYVEAFPFTGLGYNYWVYRLNSIHDPSETGVGHQPKGHDQLEELYSRYRVDIVEVEITFINASSIATLVGIFPSNANTSALSTNSAMENRDAQQTLLGAVDGMNKHTFRAKYNIQKWLGYSSIIEGLSANFGSNPTESLKLHICASTVDGTAANVNILPKIRYRTKVFERKQLDLS